MNTYLWVAVAAVIGAVMAPRLEVPVATPVLIVVALIAGITGLKERTPPPSRKPDKPRPALREPSELERRAQRRLDEVMALSLEEARRRGEETLAAGLDWRTTPPAADARPLPPEMPATLRALLDLHGRVQSADESALLSRDEVSRFAWRGRDVLTFGTETVSMRYWKIGVDADGDPTVVSSRGETVYVIHNSRSDASRWWTSEYPSIYHWLLLQTRLPLL